jgi:hypothetical protein
MFDIEEQTGTLVFEEGSALYGATIQVSMDLPLSAAQRLGELDDVDAMVDVLAQFILQWDVRWRGEDVPATAAGMKTLPVRILVAIVGGWLGQLAAPPLVLSENMSDGNIPESENNQNGHEPSLVGTQSSDS